MKKLIFDKDTGLKKYYNAQKKKILFIYPTNDGESLGIEYLSATLKSRGHKTELILLEKGKSFENELKQIIKNYDPDFICFSVVTDNYLWACQIAKLIKQIKEIPIVFGGIQVTSCPEEVISNRFIDYIVLGEGEEAIIELVENPNKLNIKNVWLRKKNKIIRNPLRPLVQDLDLLPFPDKELFYKIIPNIRDHYTCIKSRGCPFGCSYCFNNYLKKLYKGQKWLRKRSVEDVIRELEIMKKRWGCKGITFLDDCFTSDKEWLKNFIKEYKKRIDIPFWVISISSFIDKEVASLLKRGGCVAIQMGVQTPIEKMRKEICKRYDTNKDIENAVREVKKQKIAISIDHIIGLPSEKIEDYHRGLEFYINLKPNLFSLFKLAYYPNTEIIEIGKKYKTIDNETEKKIINGDFSQGIFGIFIDKKKIKKEYEEISRFIRWIPLFPRRLSRFLLRKKLYYKIPKNKYINKIPRIIFNFNTVNSMCHFFRIVKKRVTIKVLKQ